MFEAMPSEFIHNKAFASLDDIGEFLFSAYTRITEKKYLSLICWIILKDIKLH